MEKKQERNEIVLDKYYVFYTAFCKDYYSVIANTSGEEVSYTYGKSGERTGISYPGGRTVSYEYDSLLRLSGLNNGSGDAAMYTYNGLGHRTGRETNRGREDYIIDLTRPYHNMLMMTDAEKSRTFYWNGNVSAMSEITTYEITSIFHYYLQDELGSPLRVSGYGTDTEGKGNGYLTYGYDEFGNDLYNNIYNDMEDADPEPLQQPGIRTALRLHRLSS